MKYPTEVLMLAVLLFAPAAQATSILIYKAPQSPHDLRSELTVDPARRTVGVEIRINQYPGDAYSRLNLVTKVMPALPMIRYPRKSGITTRYVPGWRNTRS